MAIGGISATVKPQCSAGTRLYFAAIGRNFSVTKHAADQVVDRGVNLGAIAQYGKVYSQRNRMIFVRYNGWEARLSNTNHTVVTVVLY